MFLGDLLLCIVIILAISLLVLAMFWLMVICEDVSHNPWSIFNRDIFAMIRKWRQQK